MPTLIGNTVKTETSDYSFRTRQEAEAFFLTLKSELPLSRSARERDDPGHAQPPAHPKQQPE